MKLGICIINPSSWHREAVSRPTFEEVLSTLLTIADQERQGQLSEEKSIVSLASVSRSTSSEEVPGPDVVLFLRNWVFTIFRVVN